MEPGARPRPRFRGRPKPGVQNRTEAKYAEQLELDRRAGLIAWFAFEPTKLRLADLTVDTADFLVMRPNGELEAHEVKGFWMDDARVKIKVAAETFPMAFVAVTYRRKQWEYEWFNRELPDPVLEEESG